MTCHEYLSVGPYSRITSQFHLEVGHACERGVAIIGISDPEQIEHLASSLFGYCYRLPLQEVARHVFTFAII